MNGLNINYSNIYSCLIDVNDTQKKKLMIEIGKINKLVFFSGVEHGFTLVHQKAIDGYLGIPGEIVEQVMEKIKLKNIMEELKNKVFESENSNSEPEPEPEPEPNNKVDDLESQTKLTESEQSDSGLSTNLSGSEISVSELPTELYTKDINTTIFFNEDVDTNEPVFELQDNDESTPSVPHNEPSPISSPLLPEKKIHRSSSEHGYSRFGSGWVRPNSPSNRYFRNSENSTRERSGNRSFRSSKDNRTFRGGKISIVEDFDRITGNKPFFHII